MKLMLLLLDLCFVVLICSCGSDSSNPPSDDPLTSQQWNINNTGQNSFSPSSGTAGEDLRMTQAIADRLSGQGVLIGILDSGLEIAHEDLAANVVANGSWNYSNNTTDPTSSATDGDHGTSVAGVAAAVGYNGRGGRGVAFQANLKGFNVLSTQTSLSFIESMGGHTRSKDVQIFNMSYGSTVTAFDTLDTTVRDVYTSSSTLRDGKGGIYVKSAGNGFSLIDKVNNTNVDYKCSDKPYGLSTLTCQNAVGEEENSRPEVITVGAFSANGVRSTYSTAGSNLWVSAPGGEFGSDGPAMVTTDQSGCDKGYSRTGLSPVPNSFEIGDPTYNPACNYTSTFNGTSSAAPNTSGAIALMLQTKPSLTRRDVKHILARTARKIDPSSPAANVSVDINGTSYQASMGWITNNAGYNFHNWYGFGAVNVDAAVAMAKSYNTTLPTLQEKSYGGVINPVVAIPDNDAAGVTRTITVADDLTIENLLVSIVINHPDTAETGIEITSPKGTRSILLNIRSALKTGLNASGGVLLASNAFYGEKSAGVWTLKVLDSWPANTGTLGWFGLQIKGY